MTIDGRFFAVAAMLLAGAVSAAILIAGGISNRLTLRDVLILVCAVLVAAVAALWLYRDKRQGRQS